MRIEHGGNVDRYICQFGKMPLDFSANLSPLGMPDAVRQAAIDAMALAEHYPDPHNRALKREVCRLENVPDDQVVCGNGAADLIVRLVLATRPRKALLTAPTFAEYAGALEMLDCEIVSHPLLPREGYAVTERFLSALTDDVDMVFLCQPNNPTGVLTPRPLVQRVLERCAEIDAVLVVDECFLDFLDDADAYTMHAHLDCKNLVILRSFTKLYAMAGLRLGYCLCGASGLGGRISAAGQPWSVSNVAQAAGIAALQLPDWPEQTRKLLRAERPWMVRQLRELGLTVTEPAANFVFFEAPVGLVDKLYRNGIMLRSCANFPELTDRHYRAAIRTRNENEQFIKTLRWALDTPASPPEEEDDP